MYIYIYMHIYIYIYKSQAPNPFRAIMHRLYAYCATEFGALAFAFQSLGSRS